MDGNGTSRHYLHFPGNLVKQSELGDGMPSPRAFLAPMVDTLARFSPAELRERQAKLEGLTNELGLHFRRTGSPLIEEYNWQLDLLPRVIHPEEWKQVEKGLIQRAKAFELLLADLYGKQCILHDRVLPPQLIFDDPAFLHECRGLPMYQGHGIVCGAVDLVRDIHGRWFATQNHFSTPIGLSFTLQHRRMITQAVPELFESINIRPISSYSTDLMEALSAFSQENNPHIVLLTRGESLDSYFEDSFLARRMGISMVKPADLLVRDDRLYLKTVGGLEKVDVIYRRTESASLDPIAFGSSGHRGIPGLVNCVRKGRLAIANALGSGVIDNKALLPLSDTIIRYYLQEEPVLETVPTYHCADSDQREYVRDNLDSMLLKPIHREREIGGFFENRTKQDYQSEMRRLLAERPEMVVAQPFIDASQVPRLESGRFVPRPAYLRAFVIMGDSPSVLPGGLTRQALSADAHMRIADLTTGAKDTWIPAIKNAGSKSIKAPSPKKKKVVLNNAREIRVSSRVAESLYWIGRYCERAEHTARMVRVMEELGWAQLGRRERLNVWPLWQAVAAATGQEHYVHIHVPPAQISDLSAKLVADTVDPASLLSCIRFARNNALEIREFITPEVWSVLNRFSGVLEHTPSGKELVRTGQIHELCGTCVDEIACLNGTITRTMPHDDGWYFYRIGMLLERAISTVTVLDIVLTSALVNSDPSSPMDPDLTTLLRLLSSLDAYQREFRSRTYVAQVAELLWKSEQTPSSVAFCCLNISSSLKEILKGLKNPSTRTPYKNLEALRQHLASIRTTRLFPPLALDVDAVASGSNRNLKRMQQQLEKESTLIVNHLGRLHELIEDHFFSHQTPQTGKKR